MVNYEMSLSSVYYSTHFYLNIQFVLKSLMIIRIGMNTCRITWNINYSWIWTDPWGLLNDSEENNRMTIIDVPKHVPGMQFPANGLIMQSFYVCDPVWLQFALESHIFLLLFTVMFTSCVAYISNRLPLGHTIRHTVRISCTLYT